jgi:hypothetical protein
MQKILGSIIEITLYTRKVHVPRLWKFNKIVYFHFVQNIQTKHIHQVCQRVQLIILQTIKKSEQQVSNNKLHFYKI